MKNGQFLKRLEKLLKKRNSFILFFLFCVSLNSCKANTSNDSTESYQKGLEYLNQDKFVEAINEFDKEIQRNQNNDQAYYNRGIAKSKLLNFEDAISDYNQALKLNSKYYLAYFAKANSLKKLNNINEALENYSLAIQVKPDYEKAYFNRANTYEDIKEYDLSIKDYLKAISLNPENFEYYYNLGNTYKKNNQIEEAVISYKNAIQKNPKYAPAYNNLATTTKLEKNYTDALKYINQAIALETNLDYFNNRGNIYRAMDDFRNAKKDYTLIIEKNSNYSAAYYGRAVCNHELNLPDDAIVDLTKFLEIEPDNSAVLINRGQIFVEMKDYEKACQDFKKANSLGDSQVLSLISQYCK